jgi:hypothetical protein
MGISGMGGIGGKSMGKPPVQKQSSGGPMVKAKENNGAGSRDIQRKNSRM